MDRNAYPTLALNADYSPYATWTWQDAVRALFRGLAHGVSFYDKSVSSPSTKVVLPFGMPVDLLVDGRDALIYWGHPH